jgi:hypothetical protein
MAKKKSTDTDEASEASKKKPAKKAPAKKAEKSVKKPAAKKPAPRGKKKEPTAASADAAVDQDIIEAEILGETPVPPPADDDSDAEEPAAAAPLSDEERELAAVYGDDLSATATAHAEFQDSKTRDEDRPMMPEINAREERKAQWQDRRERRRSRRDDRERQRDQRRDQRGPQQGGGQPQQGQGGQQGHGGQPRQGQDQRPQGGQQQHDRQNRPIEMPVQVNGTDAQDGLARVGTPLGDAAAAVFAQLRNGQPLPVRQLAAMMRKRSLVNQDPEQLWPQLKAELLGDERSYRTLGLRPRIVYRGRDLFAPGPVSMSVTADAEAGVASALSKLASATHRALALRLAKASPAGFERMIHAYLVAAGYREIEWVKRVGGISYASATAPGIGRTVLISARSGEQPIDRRAIGELRVGVEAKDLVAGILMTPSELSEDAERELERAGRSIAVVCGDQLVNALITAGVGVVSSAAPMHYLDDQLLEELLAG